MPGRILLLASTHRAAPGLLSWPAWEALRGAARVLAAARDHPQAPYLAAAGVEVEVLPAASASPRALATALADAAQACAARGPVVLLGGTDGDPALGAELAAVLAARAEAGGAPDLEVLHGSWDLPGARLLDLVAVMDRLRSPGGCPWDARQTHASLVPYLLEEAYETVEAIEAGDPVGLREELGDLLLQVVFHARLAEEDPDAPWSVDDVAAGIVDKLVRRHPHVFADVDASTPAQVEANWEVTKAAEKRRASVLDGVPLAQPGLALAATLVARTAKAGLDVPPPTLDPAALAAGRAAAAPDGAPLDTGAVGLALLAVAALAAGRGVDPEAALREAARDYAARVREAERLRGPAPVARAAPAREPGMPAQPAG